MGLPARPATSTTTSTETQPAAPVVSTTATATESAPKAKSVLKKFGPAKSGEGDNAVTIPAPKAANIDLVELSKKFYAALVTAANDAGAKIEDVIAFASDADKSQFPGHKDGRIAYATANTIASLAKINGLLNKQRGAGGMASMKAKLAEKDNKLAALEAQLAELMKQINGGKQG